MTILCRLDEKATGISPFLQTLEAHSSSPKAFLFPPHPPFTANEYQRYGIPWFDYYRDDLKALEGSEVMNSVKSIGELSALKGDKVVSGENDWNPN